MRDRERFHMNELEREREREQREKESKEDMERSHIDLERHKYAQKLEEMERLKFSKHPEQEHDR